MFEQSSKSFLVVEFTAVLSDSLSIDSFCASSRNCPAQIMHHSTCTFTVYTSPWVLGSSARCVTNAVRLGRFPGRAVVSAEGGGGPAAPQGHGGPPRAPPERRAALPGRAAGAAPQGPPAQRGQRRLRGRRRQQAAEEAPGSG